MDKHNLDKMLNNNYISSFIKKHNLDNTFVNNHFSVFNDSYESISLCENCKGLESCKQLKKGEVLTLNYDGGIYNEITLCKHLIDKNNIEKVKDNFVRSDIAEIYDSLDLSNIELVDNEIENLCSGCYEILDKKRNKGLYIYGDLGVGKTYMCIALANSLAKKGNKVAFVKCNYFVIDMRSLITTDSYQYDNILNSIKKVPYLFLDDIGSETVSSFSRDDLLFNILDYRMENKLCTIFTSNLSKKSLLEHYKYDKNDNSSINRAKRLLERIDILSDDFVLKGENKRRGV